MSLAMLFFVVVMQIAPPIPIQPRPTPPAGGGSGGTGAQAQTQAPATITGKALGGLLYDAAGEGGKLAAEGGFKTLSRVWNLPDFLMNSRKPENTVDQPDAALLNDTMVKLLPGLVMVAFVLVIGYNVLSVVTGRTPNPIATIGGLTVVGLAGLAAVHNRDLQRFPIDLVNLLLSTISGAPIRDFAAPVAHVVDPITTGIDLFWAALFALAFVIILLILTVVLFIEGAWCIVLGSQLAWAALGSVVPIFGSGAQYILRRWIGSLFSPVIVFAALKLMSAMVAKIADLGGITNGDNVGLQLLAIAFACVALQAPGMMVGAIAVSFPGVAQMYFAGRLLSGGPGRFIHGDGRYGGDVRVGGARADAPRVRSAPPTRTSTHGMGGGSAVTNRTARAALA